MKSSLRAIALLCFTWPMFASAQQVTLGTLLDAESQLTLKKMHDELNKMEPGTRKTDIVLPPIGRVVQQRPETLSVFGSNSAYEAEVMVDGEKYFVRPGSRVQDYTVGAITPQGVELFKYVTAPRKRGKQAEAPEKVTVFAPLHLR